MEVFINNISYYLPKDILTNEAIATMHPEWSVEKISSKVGINERHRVSENETSGDLAIKAAEILFNEYSINRNIIDYIIFCTQSSDYFLPSTACVIQDKLHLSKRCGAFDYNLGCSGYVYGLGLAKGLILSNQAKNVLLLTGETYTKYINSKDKGNKTMFGDAATATLISCEKMNNGLNAEILEFCYGTDGSLFDSLIVKNGFAKHFIHDGVDQFDEKGNFVRNDDHLYMDGKAIFNFTAFDVPPLIEATLKKNNVLMNDIDQFIFHQANEYMLKTVRKRCGISENKFYIDIKELGNTVSNTIPIAICKAEKNGLLKNAHYILLSGFGVGLSMGAVVLRR